MQQPVTGVEVESGPDRNQYDQRDEPNRIRFKCDHCRPTVRVGVPDGTLPERPELEGDA